MRKFKSIVLAYFLFSWFPTSGQTIINYGFSSLSTTSGQFGSKLVGSAGHPNSSVNLLNEGIVICAHGIELPIVKGVFMHYRVQIYPQPSNDFFSVIVDGFVPDEIFISNIFGQIVYSGPFKYQNDINSFPQGQYIVSFFKNKNMLVNKKLIVVK
jgi:hypothetical protein